MTTSTARTRLSPWLFLAPFLATFALVFVAPTVFAIVISLFRTRLIGGTTFVGFDNYLSAIGDPKLWHGLGTVLLMLGVQVPIMLVISILLSIAIDSGRLHGLRFFRIAIFMPYAVPAVVATLIWAFMYSTRYGLVGSINRTFGANLPDPLSVDFILGSIGNIVTWEYVGFNMLIFYSALRLVPITLYEAAAIDGASEWRVVRAIKLPALRGSLLVTIVFSVIGSFQLFNEPIILHALAPNSISTYFTPNIYAYSLSFAGQQLNYSAAIAIVVGLITILIAYLVRARGARGADR